MHGATTLILFILNNICDELTANCVTLKAFHISRPTCPRRPCPWLFPPRHSARPLRRRSSCRDRYARAPETGAPTPGLRPATRGPRPPRPRTWPTQPSPLHHGDDTPFDCDYPTPPRPIFIAIIKYLIIYYHRRY